MPASNDPNNGKWTEDLERNETLLKSDPAAALGILTTQTGGMLIQNTNDLVKGIQRIDEDRRFHYLLGYTSTNPSMDGSYRHIEVKVKRGGVEVHSRQGYVALPADTGSPVLSYEAPAIAALSASPVPNAFPMQARALSIPMPGHPGLTAVMVDVATNVLTFVEDAKLGTYSANTIVLAQLDSGTPDTSRKQSQQYKLSGKLELLPQAKAGNLLSSGRQSSQAAGTTVHAVVYDAKGTKASVTSTSVTVPAAEKSVVGDLFVVARAEKLPPNDPARPITRSQQRRAAVSVVRRADQQGENAGADLRAADRGARRDADGDAADPAGRTEARRDSAAARQAGRRRASAADRAAAIRRNSAGDV